MHQIGAFLGFQNNKSEFVFDLALVDYLVLVHATPGWDVASGTGIGTNNLNCFTRNCLAYGALQANHRHWAEQAAGVNRVVSHANFRSRHTSRARFHFRALVAL